MPTHWRGAHVAPNTTPADVTAAHLKGANIFRYQFNPNYFSESIAILNSILAYGYEVVLNVSKPYEGTNPVTQAAARDGFRQLWAELADLYKRDSRVIGYGILNEPVGSGQAVNNFMHDMHDTIRSRDSLTRVIVTCPRSDPVQFYKTKFIKGDQNVWYEVHMYLPMALTHQGISGRPYPLKYPNPSRGWNRNFLESRLEHVRAFQKTNRARIYAGEFGISTFTDDESRANYYEDCIFIFEKYGWNWTAHAWREAPVWTLESPMVLHEFEKAWEKNS